MDFQGRSPLKDVTRSVLLGAAMIPASLLAGCSHHDPDNTTPTTSGNTSGNANDPGDAGSTTDAPPPEVVRPRQQDPNTMPTRGFSGGARARR